HKSAEVADMPVVIDRRPAGIHRHAARRQRREFLDLARERIKKRKHCVRECLILKVSSKFAPVGRARGDQASASQAGSWCLAGSDAAPERILDVVTRMTPRTITAVPANMNPSNVSLRKTTPRMTATTGLMYEYVATLAVATCSSNQM